MARRLAIFIRICGRHCHWAWGQMGSKPRKTSCESCGRSLDKFSVYAAGATGCAPATCGVGGQGGQSLAVALRFSDRQLGAFQPMCVLRCLRQNARTAVTTAVNGLKRNRSSPQKMRLKWGRWDRNRTCNLRFWRKRHRVLPRLIPSRQLGEARIQARSRLRPSERV